jgi:hypothetical protein
MLNARLGRQDGGYFKTLRRMTPFRFVLFGLLGSAAPLCGLADYEAESPSVLRASVAFATYFASVDSVTGISEAALPREFGYQAQIRFVRLDRTCVLQFTTARSSQQWGVPAGAIGNIQTVAAADLNGDRQPDLVIVMDSLGNGLGGSYSPVFILLSSASGFTATSLRSLFFSLSRFELLENHRVALLQSELFGGATGKDGQAHNYVVQRRLLIEAAQLSVDAAYEPKWVMYSFRPNHQETIQLTLEQERKMLTDGAGSWELSRLSSPDKDESRR